MGKVNLEVLKSHLRKSADVLRGHIDAAAYNLMRISYDIETDSLAIHRKLFLIPKLIWML